MSPVLSKPLFSTDGFPRVSGDEPNAMRQMGDAIWFSPRERG